MAVRKTELWTGACALQGHQDSSSASTLSLAQALSCLCCGMALARSASLHLRIDPPGFLLIIFQCPRLSRLAQIAFCAVALCHMPKLGARQIRLKILKGITMAAANGEAERQRISMLKRCLRCILEVFPVLLCALSRSAQSRWKHWLCRQGLTC